VDKTHKTKASANVKCCTQPKFPAGGIIHSIQNAAKCIEVMFCRDRPIAEQLKW